jgi:predicted restriction endonuclease
MDSRLIHMKKESTDFGLIATSTMPEDALNNTIWRDGVLIVNVERIEPAYIFMREHLKLKKALEDEYSAKINQLEVRDQILEELKKSITSGELDVIIDRIDASISNIEVTIAKTENYLSQVFKNMRKETSKIRELASKLVSEHIEKIRTQLIQQPPPISSIKKIEMDERF